MQKEKLKELGYYVIRVQDDDRYLREVYADNELMYVETSEKKAYERLEKIAECLE